MTRSLAEAMWTLLENSCFKHTSSHESFRQISFVSVDGAFWPVGNLKDEGKIDGALFFANGKVTATYV